MVLLLINKKVKKYKLFILLAPFTLLLLLFVWRFFFNTNNKVQIEFNIHINPETIYLSMYAEPPQFAVWLENPKTGMFKQVFVTYRVSRGDWEGKSDVPVALPHWKTIFKGTKKTNNNKAEEISISGATPRDEYFRVRAEVETNSEWIGWVEMNLAGDYNEYYPQFNKLTKEEDEFSCGQPALIYRFNITAKEGNNYTPKAEFISMWKNDNHFLLPIDSTITTAQNVFDIEINIVHPKPMIINLKKINKQKVLNKENYE